MGKDSVQVALAINNKQLWILRDQHQALLYTLPVDTTVHDLSGLLESYGGKTCFIGCNPSSYVHDRCAVICFKNETSKLAAVGSVFVFKGVNLHWASFSLACCAKCEQFGHISDVCSVGGNSGVCGKQIVTDQNRALVAHPVFFGGKTWAQVAGGISLCVTFSILFGAGQSSGVKMSSFASASSGNSDLYDCMVFLECFLGLLANQVSGILKKLSFVDLVSLAVTFEVSSPVVSVYVASGLDLNMTLDGVLVSSILFSSAVNDTVINLSSSSSKILTTKVGGLESKMLALKVSVKSVLEKLDHLCLGLGSSALFSSQ
ncbi:hypothetical protein G9A89_006036 [Geosiphon pyriformis]|nr:hypothetical protein G9A89_006036 [Geosiphon pyriformis]